MNVFDGVEEVATKMENVFTLITSFSFDLHASLTPVFNESFPAVMSPNRHFAKHTANRPYIDGRCDL